MARDFAPRFLASKFSGGNSQPNPQRIRRQSSPQAVDRTPFTPLLRNFWDSAVNRIDKKNGARTIFAQTKTNSESASLFVVRARTTDHVSIYEA
jgi:Zn-dependent M28 family amino/carboxypeptidase